MKLSELKTLAKQHGIKVGKLTKGELIRAIQAGEGNQACFGSGGAASCGQDACAWRKDCP